MTKKYYTHEETSKWISELPKKPISVKVIIYSDKNNVLLVKPNYKPVWQFPGGVVEFGEDPKLTAFKETEEETGLKLDPSNLILIESLFQVDHDLIILFYKYTKRFSESTKIIIPVDEIEDYKFVDPKEIPSQISDYYADFWDKHFS